ncbi:conjugal transfer protein TraN [Sphingomonas sp. TDK1]|uniref:conjugal transfer protein TraN n=1 Tax=Sphingomonas sp. TDK1 TaxID=453247 RepID=UPI0007D91742|nr:conjugal transfer protein TraN [Sphingomonas sp. TDK1]OAN64532.1 conjugal transfer protein TraN [Sphingomonas sp. TDK1]
MTLRPLLSTLLGICLVVGPAAAQQMTVEQAREEGKALGNAKRQDGSLVPTTDAQASAVPGYTGTDQPQSTYFDDPDALVAAGTAQRSTNDAYRTATDQGHTRATFSNSEILATTSRATAVENDPEAYLQGESIGAESGQCQPLPPGSGTNGYYEATCNQGTKVTEEPRSCSIRMVPHIVNTERWFYFGAPDSNEGNGFAKNSVMQAKVAQGICRAEPVSMHVCDAQIELGAGGDDVEGYRRYCKRLSSMNKGPAQLYSCSSAIPDGEIPAHQNYKTGTRYYKKEGESSVTVTREESGCAALASDSMCTQTSGEDVCTEGPETRVFDGVSVTQACWAWKRHFSCHVFTAGNDCGDLEGNRQCTYLRDECLDDPRDGACKVTEKVYKCPIPDGANPADKQYICGDDVYCINGDCEPIVREASTEFKDALVALHSIDQAGKEFDPDNLTVFSGQRNTCHKPVFGLVNCCAGKTSGLLTAAAGGAALAGGPAAIAALATPFLSVFMCSQKEMQLDIKDRMGFCHRVGTYCSDSFLGVCTSKSTAYCCFESKLSRILQEQGRPQINKPWGAPKKEQCKGFTIDEFARLDLSVMDFTEVYAEFIDAAKLPDEVQTMTEIQQKIQNYYDLHGGQP